MNTQAQRFRLALSVKHLGSGTSECPARPQKNIVGCQVNKSLQVKALKAELISSGPAETALLNC